MNRSKTIPPLTVLVTILVTVMTATTLRPTSSVNAKALSAGGATTAIYDDRLAANWQDWSWNSSRNLRNSNPVQSGSRSISVKITSGWGALYLHSGAPVSTSGYTDLEFYINGGSNGGQQLNVIANRNNRNLYPVSAAANTWTKVSVPLSSLGSPASLADLYFQDATGRSQAVFYLDGIALVDNSGGSQPQQPTQAPTQAPTGIPTLSPTQAPTRAPTLAPTLAPTQAPTNPPSNPGASNAIYADALASGWQDWSWDSSRNLSNSSPVQSGSRSMSVQITAAWGALYLHHNGVSTGGYTDLEFYVNGGANGGQQLKLIANRNSSQTYTFTAQANTWSRVSIPLSSIGSPGSLADLFFQDAAGRSQPVFYIDSLALTAGGGGTYPTPAPTQAPSQPTPQPTTPSSSAFFDTLPPGSKLPSDAECASLVKSRPENKRTNAAANNTRGNQGIAGDFFTGGDNRANTEIGVRVDGNFTGTTDEILQWAACKWGFNEDIVRAQAAVESWWRQSTKGDWTTNAANCAPGHGIGADGQPGQCPESFGILQNRYPYEKSGWPGMDTSTAFNADLAYAEMRACYEGYETWLNNVEKGSTYAAGDVWGCVGRWYAGRWHTSAAESYASTVKSYLNQRIWETSGFQEP